MYAGWLMIGFTVAACLFAHYAAPRRTRSSEPGSAVR